MNKEQILKFLELVNAKRIKVRNDWVMCSCLFKEDHETKTDNRPSFGISISNPSYYHCFACNRKGLLYEIQPLLRYYNLDPEGKAYDFIRNNETFEFRLVENSEPKTAGVIPYYQYEKYKLLSSQFKGITLKMAKTWDIREHNEYVFIPIFDKYKRLIDVKIRSRKDPDFKMMPSEKFYPDLQRINGIGAKASGVWFGMHFELEKNTPITLVEGERDAILLSKYIKNVWASMGATITQAQIKTLQYLDVPIILFFDNDSAGNLAKEKIIKELGHKELFYVKHYFDCKDPAELIEKKLLFRALLTIEKVE